MNRYLKNLQKIEFVVTHACTGRCKHCSEGEHSSSSARIDPHAAAEVVRRVASVYDIKTVMTFGGEPLLHTDAVFEIMDAACEMNIPHRQLITNGYFSRDEKRIDEVARRICECKVNDLRLSVDAFHQETIPLDVVRIFASKARGYGVPITLQPAWLVSVDSDNPYNRKTREILDSFSDMDIPTGDGNIIFPAGNALRFLSEYFEDGCPENPYVENPEDVRCLSVLPNGEVLDGNIYESDILDIIRNYRV